MTDHTDLAPGRAPGPSDADPKGFLQAALAHALRLGGRELRIGPEAVVVDGLGRTVRLARGGVPARPALRAIAEHLSVRAHRWEEGYEFPLLGTWTIRRDRDGGLALRARRPAAACLEAVVDAAPADLAALRGLYRHAGVDVRVSCAGEARAREFAQALAAERRLAGLPTRARLDIPRHPGSGRTGLDMDAGPFDMPAALALPAWRVEQYEAQGWGSPAPSPPGAESRVHVVVDRNNHFRSLDEAEASGSAAPAVMVRVDVVRSRAVASVTLSASARALSSAAAPFPDAPWDRLAERRAARTAARPRKPRVCHATLGDAMEAFLSREAERGYVSNQALYFHGPVAYASHDRNPVAAFVRAPDGEPLLLRCGTGQQGGLIDGVIRAGASHHRCLELDLIAPFLTLGGHPLDRIPSVVRWDKSVGGLPREAEVVPGAVSAWVAEKHARLDAELAAAYRTRYPTLRQAQAYRALAAHARTRAAAAALLGIDLPDVGDPAGLDRREGLARAAAGRHADERERRARLAGGPDAGPQDGPRP